MAESDVPPSHDRHDATAIAEAADRGGPGRLARTLMAACGDCARLAGDLQALALALPATATPARPRDFTLAEADARRLRSRSLRRWLARIGTASDSVTRPLAVGLTTLGIAGLLVATVPAIPIAGSGAASASAAPAQEFAPLAVEAAPSATAEAVPDEAPAGQAAPVAGDDTTVERSSGGPSMSLQASPAPSTAVGGPSPMLILSSAFLGIGGGLFVIRRLAGGRRVR